MTLSCLALAYARPLGAFAANVWGVGEGDWDPKWKSAVKSISIGIAVTAFYGLDFAVNALVREPRRRTVIYRNLLTTDWLHRIISLASFAQKHVARRNPGGTAFRS